MSRNSITPSRALRTIGERVESTCGVPSFFGGRSLTPIAQDACGLGVPTTSIRHMRQLPAIESRSWKQKRGISAPAASHACNSVYSGGTSISLPSTISLVIAVLSLSQLAIGRCDAGGFQGSLHPSLRTGAEGVQIGRFCLRLLAQERPGRAQGVSIRSRSLV